jgi:hypothetical protein
VLKNVGFLMSLFEAFLPRSLDYAQFPQNVWESGTQNGVPKNVWVADVQTTGTSGYGSRFLDVPIAA